MAAADDPLLRFVRPHLHAAARPFPFQPPPPDALHLDLNEGAYGPTPAARQAILGSLPSLNRYPDAAAAELKAAIAERHGLTPAHVLLGPGSNPVLSTVIRATCGPDDRIAYPWPGFPAYELSARAQGIATERVPVRVDGHDDIDGLVAASARCRLVVLATPSNPTSLAATPAEVADLIERVAGRALVVLDEAYAEYTAIATGAEAAIAAGLPVVVTRTFSKIWGLAGLRIGYALLPPTLARSARQAQETFEFTQPSMLAALASLRHDGAEAARRADENRRVRAAIAARLAAHGLDAYPSEANFVTARVADPSAYVAALFELGVLVRGLAVYGDAERVRITVPMERDLPRLLAALDRVGEGRA